MGLFQSDHLGGCKRCSSQPTQTLAEVRHDFNIQSGLDKMASVIRASAEVFASLHISLGDLASALRAARRLMLLDVRKPEGITGVGHEAFPAAVQG